MNESSEKNHQNYNQITLVQGDALEILRTLPDQFINAGITSPPYFGLRDYGIKGQLGLEKRPEDYIDNLVQVFHELRRTLRNDGTFWLVIGDSYLDKNLLGIPWRLALALQADEWILRQDIIWDKTNPMPNSAKDRCTGSHEYIFLLAKSEQYYFDYESIMEPAADPLRSRRKPRVFGAKNPVGTLRHDTGNTFTDNGGGVSVTCGKCPSIKK